MYYIGETRTLTTKSKCDGIHVIINDTISNEQIDLSPERWKAFRTQFPTISAAVNEQKENQFVKYLHEIGDDWYVSVTNGFFTVDIRQVERWATDRVVERNCLKNYRVGESNYMRTHLRFKSTRL